MTCSVKKVVVGLCEGRHEMPVESYIFTEELDPADIAGIEAQALQWVKGHCNTGDVLEVYVTGLTVALTAIIKACADRNVYLVLRHYDRDSGEYLRQEMILHSGHPCHRCGGDWYTCAGGCCDLRVPDYCKN